MTMLHELKSGEYARIIDFDYTGGEQRISIKNMINKGQIV